MKRPFMSRSHFNASCNPLSRMGSVMINKIVELIVEQSRQTDGQNVAARIHTVLMEVRQAVARVIAEEQQKEREQNRPVPNTCD